MTRLLAALAGLLLTSAASAHFVFIVPDGPSASTAKVVFSDTLQPDDRVGIEKIAGTKLSVGLPDGKRVDLKGTVEKPGAFYKLDVPGEGSRVVTGFTDFGVLQRGESKPFRLLYYPKAIFGPVPVAEKATSGPDVPLELVPVTEGNKLRLQVVTTGRPLARAEVSVFLPGAEKAKEFVTDEKGLTAAFEQPGLYGARVRLVEKKSGEEQGKKYDEIRHYATLALYFGKTER